VLLDCEIPHVAGVRAVVTQHCLLGGRREQPIARHTNILASATDILGRRSGVYPAGR
jgi:hypothetical protein